MIDETVATMLIDRDVDDIIKVVVEAKLSKTKIRTALNKSEALYIDQQQQSETLRQRLPYVQSVLCLRKIDTLRTKLGL